MKKIQLITLLLCSILTAQSQTIIGKITSDKKSIPFSNIIINGTKIGGSSEENGDFKLENAPLGKHTLIISAINMIKKKINLNIKEGVNIIDIELSPSIYNLDQVVITGTKTFKRKTESPVIVNVIDSRKLQNVQACNLSEGLNFQPGLRIETDCQTCNYTQLRMNGLAGSYSQILINGKAIFSPLTGLYGMEQIPANMIDRIEIVKGGGSALYGSSAIGGTVNVITKTPQSNNYNFGYNFGRINNNSNDYILYANTTILSDTKKSGATLFVNNRERMSYDHNNDNYSELPEIKDNTFGANFFFLPSPNSKLELNVGSLYEYRYGGEMIEGPPHLNMQAEERTHNILLGNLDYQINFNKQKSSFIAYIAAQKTERNHYTGIRPEIGTNNDIDHLVNPPYGISLNTTKQAGIQFNHNIKNLLEGNMITIGTEYVTDNIKDEIPAYNYLINQNIKNIGSFIQSDWKLTKEINLLSGARFDKHSLLEHIVTSPRLSLLYKLRKKTQFRVSYSTGFRAPQAFDTDLHMAFAGGGISRIKLADNLKEERSKSLSASINYDQTSKSYIYGFTLEGFYTRLNDAFYQDPVGEDEFGEIFIKRNGNGATVQGLTIEVRTNIHQKIQIESGLTYQKSEYDSAVSYSTSLPGKREFLRTPQKYAYATLDYLASEKINLSANLVHTGSMYIVHMAGAPNQNEDVYLKSENFNVIGIKATYIKKMKRLAMRCEYSIGVKNITNDYQDNFDISKNRDSNFIYGPSNPRIFYLGLMLKSL